MSAADNDDLELRRKMRAIGATRREAAATLKRTAAELEPLVRAAHAAGVPITEIAKDSALSREKVYAILG